MLFVATVDAVFIGVALVLVGVPMALPLIVLTWLGAFFPIVGAIVAGAAAVLVALVAEGLTSALIVLVAIILVQQLESNAGLAGAFLAVPIATVGAALLEFADDRRR